MEPNNLSPQPQRKILPAFLAILIVLGLSASAYYFFSSSYKSSGSNPPRITINYPTYKGDIGVGVCQIPGMHEFTSDAVSTDTAAASTLQLGIHIYHSDTDVTVQKILDKIDAVNGNKILIAYYPSINNIDQKFSVYPELAGQNTITTPATYTIPANEGFIIFACKESKIHGIKTETEYGSALPTILETKNTGWVLAATPQPESGKKFKDTLGKSKGKKKMKSTWPQQGTDAYFGETEKSPDTVELEGSYKMVWVEFGNVANSATKPAPITDLKTEIASDKKSIILTWKAPDTTETVSYIITYYDGVDGKKIDEKTATTTGFTLTSVNPGKSYRFAVDTVYPDGNKSGGVSSGVIKIPTNDDAKPVSKVEAKLAEDNKSIKLIWTAPNTDLPIKYSVSTYVNGSKKDESSDIKTTEFTATKINPGLSYYFTIQVLYPHDAFSEIVTSKTIDVPAGTTIKGVTDLKAELDTDKTSVKLTWTAPTDKKLLYTVNEYYDNGDKPGTFINTFFGGDSKALTGKFTTQSLEPGKSYHFTIIAEYLDGSKSDPVKSNTVAVPNPPATPPSAPVLSIITSNTTDHSAFFTWTKPISDGGSAVTQYDFAYGSSCTTLTNHDTVLANYKEHLLSNLAPATKYAVTVKATNEVNNNSNWSPASNCVEFTTLSKEAAAPKITSKPSNGYIGNTSAYVYWGATNVDSLKSIFKVQYKEGGCSATTTQILTPKAWDSENKSNYDKSPDKGYVAVLGKPYTTNDLKPGTKYGVIVAVGNDGTTWSADSACLEFTTTGTAVVEVIPGYKTVDNEDECPSGWTASKLIVGYQYGCKENVNYQCSPKFTCSNGIYLCFKDFKCDGTASCLDSSGKEIGKPVGTGYLCSGGTFTCSGKLTCNNLNDSSGCGGTKTCSE